MSDTLEKCASHCDWLISLTFIIKFVMNLRPVRVGSICSRILTLGRNENPTVDQESKDFWY